MKVIVNGLNLSDASLKVVKAIASKTVNPVLECIRLTAKGDDLILTATDMDFFMQKKIPAEVFMEGEVLVKGKVFADFIQKLDKEQIELSTLEEGKLTIKYTDAESALPAMGAEEFPEVKTETGEKFVTMKRGELKDLINKVAFSCSTDDTRPLLKGSLMEVNGTEVTAVALDGYRLAVCRKQAEEVGGNFSAIIPSRILMEISRILEGDEESVTLSFKENGMVVEIDDTVIYGRLIEGSFIDYKNVIPTSYSTDFIINKESLENAISRASVCARVDKNNLVKFDIRENTLHLKAETVIGKVNEKLMIDLNGKDLEIAFNGAYLRDALKVVDEEFVKLHFNNELSPCVLKPCDGEEFLYLLLPVRVIDVKN